jgi:hypothetical protein
MHQQRTHTSTSQEEGLIGSLREQHALLLRLKELRRLGQHDEARQVARYLELLDRSDDWAMRYSL